MDSRERVLRAINHEEPDRVPIDLGGSISTGIMAGALARLRQHLGLNGPVKVYDVFQMLGEVAFDLVARFDLDLLPVEPGPYRGDHKPWTLFDGTEVLMPGNFNVAISPEGHWLMHQGGDPTKPVIARMPKDGYYFDVLADTSWNPDYVPPSIEALKRSGWRRLTDETLRHLQEKARTLREATNKALVLTNWGGAVLGPPWMGSLAEWMVVQVTEPAYTRELFDLAAEVALDNLALYWEAIGEDIDILFMDGFDYGTQNAEMFSPALFEALYEPCYKKQCDWIHQHTPWKVAKHCCGSIPKLIEPMIRAGIDILNPVQTSAKGMDPQWLKDTFGDRLTFWGGGADTQRVLPFGTPEDVRRHVADRVRIFGPGGGFIWSAVHNIQYHVPPENIVAALDTVREAGRYPIL